MTVSKLNSLVHSCHVDCVSAGLALQPEFLRRLIASLLAKRFLILTGLSGSGKTKVAQSFARWITTDVAGDDPFKIGAEIPSDRITYYVRRSDRLAVEFWNAVEESNATKVVLPRALIQEWADYIQEKGLTRDAPARHLRDAIETATKFSKQLNSFETHLKAAAFAVCESRSNTTLHRRYEVVAVGADWTSNEQVLGYADGLNPNRYVRTKALDIILRAESKPDQPYFLILDEMNLSHVERYFADILSALESDEPIHLHSDRTADGRPAIRDGVPGEIRLPANLFVIGTVNIDETTYMFSPKVLDRANVIEFRIRGEEMAGFLDNPKSVSLPKLDGRGAEFGQVFVARSGYGLTLEKETQAKLKAELLLFFDVLTGVQSEFGFRVAKEIAAFIETHRALSSDDWDFRSAMDAQIVQKLLPRLHGARAKLEPVLSALAILCHSTRSWNVDAESGQFDHIKALRSQAVNAAKLDDESLDPLGARPDGSPTFEAEGAYYFLSFDKLTRMLARLRNHGFVSFAEA
ncbi:McrB family protein [Horticoccus sp. 23ND18S-11]|uniref:McrB family protein n=1 Tax=Horticoccus sp. 23ND18S-11 TaxID=3391832 RepID=UPI0039C9B5E2